jgi:hypothetical protein
MLNTREKSPVSPVKPTCGRVFPFHGIVADVSVRASFMVDDSALRRVFGILY